MIIGVPREIKVDENRVGLVPAGVEALVSSGHRVIVESNCAVGIGLGNEQYIAAGAEIADLPSDVKDTEKDAEDALCKYIYINSKYLYICIKNIY